MRGSDTSEAVTRVLCIAGSPRRRGNSDRLLDAAEAGIRDAGGLCTRLVVADAGIAPCQGCNACSSSGVCVIRDTMDDIYPLIDSADAIIVSSPVYFATVPAVLKALYDRCQPYWARRYVLGEPPAEKRRHGALMLVGGGGDPFGTACAEAPTKSVFAVLGVELVHKLEFVGADSPTDIARHADVLDTARNIGLQIAGSGRLS